jgi:hypothetical protein
MAATPPDTASSAAAWRLRVYPVVVLAVLAVVVVVAALGAGDRPGGAIGGDFPAFYGAGEIVRTGDVDNLYDAATQQAAQAGLIDDEGGFLFFAYPPVVAGVFAVFGGLGFTGSFLVHTAFMAAALAAVVRLGRRWFPWIARSPTAAFTLALVGYPLLRSVLGGQNTALTLLLIVAAAHYDDLDRPFAAGLMIGLLAYKPQFAVPFVLLLVVARRWRSLAGAAAAGAGVWAASAVIAGPGWVTTWWREARAFAEQNEIVNGKLFISLPGALGHLFGDAGAVVGWLGAAAIAVAIAYVWWREPSGPVVARYGFAAAGIVLVLPQPLFYEAGLVAPLLVAIASASTRWVRPAIMLWVATWTQVLADALGFAPTVIVVAVAIGWGWGAWRSGRLSGASPSTVTTPV